MRAMSLHSLSGPAIEVVVVQPTPFCNINCRYCYLPERDVKNVMSLATVEALFAKVFASGWTRGDLTVIWHAGEPLVVPVAFYEAAFQKIESLRPSSLQLHHSFQTNGTLITPRWCDLFRKWHIGVGVSIDGPRHFNDQHRVTRTGRSTFDRTIEGIRTLRRENIPFHVISVLSGKNIDAPQEMLDFYLSEGIEDICFNIEESEGEHTSELFAQTQPQGRFKRFLSQFWALARQNGRIRFIREIDAMLPRVFRSADGEFRNVQVEPLAMLNVDCEGRVSTFSPELLGLKHADYADFIIGNITTDSLDDMLRGPALHAMQRDISAGVALCRDTCEYFSVCGGGAPVNKLSENGSFGTAATSFCRVTQMVPVDIILDAFESLKRSIDPPSAVSPQGESNRMTPAAARGAPAC